MKSTVLKGPQGNTRKIIIETENLSFVFFALVALSIKMLIFIIKAFVSLPENET